MGKKTQQWLLLFLYLTVLVHCSAAMMFWTAFVEISYIRKNETVDRACECGVFGQNSPIEKASGIVTLPMGDPTGCGPNPIYNRTINSPLWIALVKRGNCTFTEKISAASNLGASAVVVYNVDGSGNSTTHMSHPEVEDIVAIMIGNSQGMEVLRLMKNGIDVEMTILVGNPHGPWVDTYWLYFLSIAFFIVTAASIAYFVFISASRLYNLNRHRRAQKRLKSEAKNAIKRLQVRTMKSDDVETMSDSHMCAVCIESYKAGEVVTVLTCDHIFHKACIEPWLLERRTCPMCKCDILKALGVEEEVKEDFPTQSPLEVTVITVTGGDNMYEVPLTDTGSLDPDRHRYDNRAFEGDSEAARG
ncbi:E3 ubiquitin-protein ligase RNF128a [Betta splendens]|uniref:E3 ubiquitin-protein ligase RNF128a n=1 Tax=Betta splendens TaxID=158456 RepID=A0A6P7KQA3_BETSP|nr:E3 ubiquitin-protein ligase RNF128a [Betta splendens]